MLNRPNRVFAGMIRARSRTANGRRSLLRDENGAVAAIVAIFLTVLLGFGAYAIDMSYAYTTRNLLQVTASAAALAAAQDLATGQAQAVATARSTVRDNMPRENHGDVLDPNDIVFGNWNTGSKTFTAGITPINAVQITTRRSTQNDNELDLFLAPILGKNSLDMEASAVGYFQAPQTLDVVLVQDVTVSFDGEIHNAQNADHALLTCLSGIPDTKMGLTVFTGDADHPNDLDEVVSIQDRMEDLRNAIDAIDECGENGMPSCRGSTNIAIGIETASQMLAGSTASRQVIVLVSDGVPFAGTADYEDSAYYNRYCSDGRCNGEALTNMAQDAAADFGSVDTHDLYVIFYENPDFDYPYTPHVTDPENWLPNNIVQGQGTYHSTPNPDELDSLMSQLCSSIGNLRLVM